MSAAFRLGVDGLTFSLTGAGISLDPATGTFRIAPEAFREGMAVTVDLGGTDLGFRLSPLDAAPSVPVPARPVMVAPPALAGSGVIGAPVQVAPGTWQDADGFAYQWRRDGTAIPGATGTEYLPVETDDRGALSCVVTARGAGGEASAEAGPLAVVRPAPLVVALPAELAVVQGEAARIEAAAFFAGTGLVYTLTGAGAVIDVATGVVTLSAELPAGPVELVVGVGNSGGEVAVALKLLVAPAGPAKPAVVGALADLALVQGAAPAEVDAAAAFDGAGLRFAVAGAGAGIDAETGRVEVPAAALLRGGRVTVTATTPEGGSAQVGFGVEVTPALAAPVAAGDLPDIAFLQGSGPQTVSAQAGFAGTGLAYALEAAPAAAGIRAGSGLVTLPTDTAFEPAEVRVRASNAAGGVSRSFRVSVRRTASVFDTAGALAELGLVALGGAASWTAGNGFGRLVPPAGGRVHGDWALAAGDGLYRCLVRWDAASRDAVPRPFCLTARLTRAGDTLAGVRLEPFARPDGTRWLELRDYAGTGTESVEIAAAPVAWEWATWQWLELALDGASVRARLYPQAAPAPDWQLAATTAQAGPGGFGPGGFSYNSQSPEIDVQRLEFSRLAADGVPGPLTATEQDWTLDQVTEQ